MVGLGNQSIGLMNIENNKKKKINQAVFPAREVQELGINQQKTIAIYR